MPESQQFLTHLQEVCRRFSIHHIRRQLIPEGRNHFPDIESKILIFIPEVLIKRGAPDHGSVAQLVDGQLLKPLFLQQRHKGILQRKISFLNT